jgi:hypothetical protein
MKAHETWDEGVVGGQALDITAMGPEPFPAPKQRPEEPQIGRAHRQGQRDGQQTAHLRHRQVGDLSSFWFFLRQGKGAD